MHPGVQWDLRGNTPVHCPVSHCLTGLVRGSLAAWLAVCLRPLVISCPAWLWVHFPKQAAGEKHPIITVVVNCVPESVLLFTHS